MERFEDISHIFEDREKVRGDERRLKEDLSKLRRDEEKLLSHTNDRNRETNRETGSLRTTTSDATIELPSLIDKFADTDHQGRRKFLLETKSKRNDEFLVLERNERDFVNQNEKLKETLELHKRYWRLVPRAGHDGPDRKYEVIWSDNAHGENINYEHIPRNEQGTDIEESILTMLPDTDSIRPAELRGILSFKDKCRTFFKHKIL